MKNILLISCCALQMSGCSLFSGTWNALTPEKVEPWQRDILAQDSMQYNPDAMQSYADDHIYFSKESATGGTAVGGGGCGCN